VPILENILKWIYQVLLWTNGYLPPSSSSRFFLQLWQSDMEGAGVLTVFNENWRNT
jgi:hypothetical protein